MTVLQEMSGIDKYVFSRQSYRDVNFIECCELLRSSGVENLELRGTMRLDFGPGTCETDGNRLSVDRNFPAILFCRCAA